MAGRGFLKSRLTQKLAAKESEEPAKSPLPTQQEFPKPEELPKSEELTKKQDENIPKSSVPVECPPSIIGERQLPLRGRRVISIILYLKKLYV